MKLTRRQFLALTGLGITVGTTGIGYAYLNDEKMEPAPRKSGRIITDLHCHPAHYKDDKATLEMLCSPGIVGLTFINHGKTGNILTYGDALKRFSGLVEEIDKGQLARIKNTSGYFARTQEITGDTFHILAVGFSGDYLPNYIDARKTVEEIHKRGGLAILNHPEVTPDREARVVKYRFVNDKERKQRDELCEMVDEIEIFNAQNINPTFGLIVPNMKKANDDAEVLARGYDFKGIVTTDTHHRLEQPKICGIYIDERDLCLEKLKDDIKTGNFDNSYRRYVSKLSFVLGMFVG